MERSDTRVEYEVSNRPFLLAVSCELIRGRAVDGLRLLRLHTLPLRTRYFALPNRPGRSLRRRIPLLSRRCALAHHRSSVRTVARSSHELPCPAACQVSSELHERSEERTGFRRAPRPCDAVHSLLFAVCIARIPVRRRPTRCTRTFFAQTSHAWYSPMTSDVLPVRLPSLRRRCDPPPPQNCRWVRRCVDRLGPHSEPLCGPPPTLRNSSWRRLRHSRLSLRT